MPKLTDQQIAEYFHRSYTSVDGLWFMKVEDRYGFDAALDVDDEVWKVVPKIQARALKAMLKASDGLAGLRECLTTKLAIEGFEFRASNAPDQLTIIVTGCPWMKLLAKSGREHLAEKISRRICQTEHAVWAAEFGNVQFEMQHRLCNGDRNCTLCFAASQPSPL